jgi:K+ transporter
MLWTTSVIVFVFWLLGISESFTKGGYIHILLGISLAVVVIQFIRNRNDLVRAKQKYEGAFQLQGRKENQPRHSRDLTN